jgi:hypothetical protein
MFVQNLKREGGRPDSPIVRFDALPWRVKGACMCANDGLRGFFVLFVLYCEGDFFRRRPDGVLGIDPDGDVGGESGSSGERGNVSPDIGERGGGCDCDSRVKGRCEDGVVGEAKVEGISRDITYECLRSCFSASSLWTATLKRCQKLGSWTAAMDGVGCEVGCDEVSVVSETEPKSWSFERNAGWMFLRPAKQVYVRTWTVMW